MHMEHQFLTPSMDLVQTRLEVHPILLLKIHMEPHQLALFSHPIHHSVELPPRQQIHMALLPPVLSVLVTLMALLHLILFRLLPHMKTQALPHHNLQTHLNQ